MKYTTPTPVSIACVAGLALAFATFAPAADGASNTDAAGRTDSEGPVALRPRFDVGNLTEKANGVAYLLRTEELGTVAVTTAHAFKLNLLAKADRVEFERLDTSEIVATSSRLATFPGLPFYALGGRLDRAFLVYLLDETPSAGFSPDSQQEVEIGEEVSILGAEPADGGGFVEIHGRIARSSPIRIEVEPLDPRDLSGWGGAPVIRTRTGRVIGFLQAQNKRGGASTLVLTPIGRVLDAIADPLEKGAGQPFAAFADIAALRAGGDQGTARKSLLQQGPERPGVRLRIEYPPNGAVVEDSICGSFLAGVASGGVSEVAGLTQFGELRRFDVIFVLDNSFSTFEPTGIDVNGNGIVGRSRNTPGSMLTIEFTDPGDSILAAEVAAARMLLEGFDPRSTRVGLVTFGGANRPNSFFQRIGRTPVYAETQKPLTDSYEQIERALDDILALKPIEAGATHMAAGLDQGTIELLGLRGAISRPYSKSQKLIFFFTDGQPTLPFPNNMSLNVAETFLAADRARRGNITVHPFAIGPDALSGPIALVEMATRTGGTFTPVRHPGELANVVKAVEFASLRNIEVIGANGKRPLYFNANEDGSFTALMKLDSGINDVLVLALASDGTRTRVNIEMRVAEGVRSAKIPQRLAGRHNQLLEQCLADVKKRGRTTEKELKDSVRQELLLEIERERAKAQRRAEEQRKELELEIER